MISVSTGEVLGVDSYFLTMMNNKLSSKQVVQEEIRLNALIPEINIELLQKLGVQNTLLSVGNMAGEEGIQIEMTKKVRLKLKSTKIYNGIKIGILSIGEINNLNDWGTSKMISRN